jgi:hypothetical protein
MNLFEIDQGLPLPDWVKTKEYDIKEILGKEIFIPEISF